MLLRRYHNPPPDEGDPDGTAPDGEQTTGTDDAPQTEKPAGRSRTRKTKEG
ncbi:hypothetical protein [Streptomyces montanisoli]|uniref:Uncharacterized protein n=1 Tax=Streptomyces montanisoli TaxID=2798581 RepID=A0A940RSX9_9ACTN|nr:hypothetical protein [Streptomyces montanisoli]MBP0456247.1 hypothetical protein [Streptomyces montanisoli]